MASFTPDPSTIASLTALILVFLLTLPTLWSLFNQAKSKAHRGDYEEIHKLYQDRDGVATEDSQKEYSAAIAKYTALSSSILGLIASIAIAAFTSVNSVDYSCLESWLSSGTWVRDYPICSAQATNLDSHY